MDAPPAPDNGAILRLFLTKKLRFAFTQDKLDAMLQTIADKYAGIQRIETQDDDLFSNLSEVLATHPMIIKRIEQIRAFAASNNYQHLQSLMNQNLG